MTLTAAQRTSAERRAVFPARSTTAREARRLADVDDVAGTSGF